MELILIQVAHDGNTAKEIEEAGGPVYLSVDLDKLQGRWKLIYSSAFSSHTLGGSRPGPPTGRLLPISLGQASLRSERERADDFERKYAAAVDSIEEKRKKLEETEKRVHQLQESLNRCVHTLLFIYKYFQRDLRAPRQRMKNPENDIPQPRKLGKDITKEKACFDGMKKKKSPCWPRMKLLGY